MYTIIMSAVSILLIVIYFAEANLQCGDETLPAIGYIGNGYNILKGDPLAISANGDAGIAGTIFNLNDCSQGGKYKGYSVPNNVKVLGQSICKEDQTYSEMSGCNNYSSSVMHAVSGDISISAPFGKIAFSASDKFQEIYTESISTHSIYISSHAECSVYRAQLDGLPSFSDNFQQRVAALPLNYDNNKTVFIQFINDFGTHYIKEIQMGGRFGTISTMSSSTYITTQASEFDLKLAAKYATIQQSSAESTLSDEQKKTASTFLDKLTTKTTRFNVGGNVPRDFNIQDWEDTLLKDPMPIHYKLGSISDLLSNDKSKQALNDALNDYCYASKFNVKCDGYPPDPAKPPKSILQGFFSNKFRNNPYTNDFNCPTGYTSILFHYGYPEDITYVSNPVVAGGNAFYCLNEDIFAANNGSDPYNEFGGLYQICRTDGSYATLIGNYFNDNKAACPTGYTAQSLARTREWHDTVWKEKDPAGAAYTNNHCTIYPYHWIDKETGMTRFLFEVTMELNVCYRDNIMTNEDPLTLGGFYSTCTQSEKNVANPYTQTVSCPEKFTAKNMFKYGYFDYNDPKKLLYHWCSVDMCLPSI